jgi:two-component system, cell cycle response regulator
MREKSEDRQPVDQYSLLLAELKKLKSDYQKLSELVHTDSLTGLYNYRHFTAAIEQEMERSRRTGQPTILIMLDYDHFKKVNDNWGHNNGNRALILLASCLRNTLRKFDTACRYGGEEFAIILPGTDLATGVKVAERLRKTIALTPLVIDDNQSVKLTISLGVALYQGNQKETAEKLIKLADTQLYRAKKEGRNRVCY